MISTRKSIGTGVTFSNGIFSQQAASANLVNDDIQPDLITFLSTVQKYNVLFLPLMSQPSLGLLGEGWSGSGKISQSRFSAEASLAFKRFHGSGDSDRYFLPLVSEVLILSQPPIQNHPNIVSLTGVCWEIDSGTQEAVPVLVFEKATWDMKQFMNAGESVDLTIDDRLNICANIGDAIMALHAHG